MKASKSYAVIKDLFETGNLSELILVLQDIDYDTRNQDEETYICCIAEFLYCNKLYTALWNYLGYANDSLGDFFNDGEAQSRIERMYHTIKNKGNSTAIHIYALLYNGLNDNDLKLKLRSPEQVSIKSESISYSMKNK